MHIPFSLKNWHWGVAELLALAATACAGASGHRRTHANTYRRRYRNPATLWNNFCS